MESPRGIVTEPIEAGDTVVVTPEWFTREQIDSVIRSMSAADLVGAMDKYDSQKQSTQWAMYAFDLAAERVGLSNGTPAQTHVRMIDFAYLAERISEVINVEHPLSSGQEG